MKIKETISSLENKMKIFSIPLHLKRTLSTIFLINKPSIHRIVKHRIGNPLEMKKIYILMLLELSVLRWTGCRVICSRYPLDAQNDPKGICSTNLKIFNKKINIWICHNNNDPINKSLQTATTESNDHSLPAFRKKN